MDMLYEIVSRLANSGFCNKKYRSWVQRKEAPIGILTINQTTMPFDSIRTHGKVRHVEWAMWKPLPFLIRSKIHYCLHSHTITMAPILHRNSPLACHTIQDMANQLLVQFNNFIIFPSFRSRLRVPQGLSTWDEEWRTAMKDAITLSWLNHKVWWHILQLKTNIQCDEGALRNRYFNPITRVLIVEKKFWPNEWSVQIMQNKYFNTVFLSVRKHKQTPNCQLLVVAWSN